MRRRRFTLGLVAVAALLPAAARAQRRAARIGFLITGAPVADPQRRPSSAAVDAFRAGMKALGYVEGRDFVMEERQWLGRTEKIPVLAHELVAKNVDAIVAVGPESIAGARSVTDRVPIIMLFSSDPVELGWAKSLRQPGGNITGLTWDAGPVTWAKHLELLKEALPAARGVALLWNSSNPGADRYRRELEKVAPRLGLALTDVAVAQAADLEDAFARIAKASAQALIVLADPLTVPNRQKIMSLATKARLPTLVTADFGFPDALLVYGPHIADMPKRAARYVDRILKGDKASELPIEQPLKYDLILDLRVAHALGLKIPPSVILRADRVIE